jgi:4-amino-4-deoxy-L-arabinose transferase-like glycosyltransferase
MSAAAPHQQEGSTPQRRVGFRWEWAALAAIVLGAGALRLIGLGKVAVDPFYDAAVRSMAMSWHNFFFGAFEPGGSVSIDKPPVDLWLQVASVKLLGFGSTSLKLPQALAGTTAVGLLYVPVRRVFGVAAGLGAALALAVMPIEVITARSDTMDAVMMLLLVLALLCVVRACESGSTGWLLAAAAALGVAFDVKLLESLVALPGLGLIALLGFRRGVSADRPEHGEADGCERSDTEGRHEHPGVWRRRVLPLGAAAAVFVAVALSWLTATLAFPAHDRPYAIGSTDGSAWNAAFVFNGLDRIEGKSIEGPPPGAAPRHPPQATLGERERISVTPPSPTRLLDRIGPLSGERLGLEALIALLLGVPAVLLGLRGARLRTAVGLGLTVWLATGLVLFSQMTRLHPRYVEGFTPAVAALVGIGVAWATQPRARIRLVFLGVALAALLGYAAHLLYGLPPIWWAALACALGAVALAWFDRVDTGVLAVALALAAVLAIPTQASIRAVRLSVSDAGNVGSLPAEELQLLSSYLRAHQGSAHYEVAADSATKAGALIVRDGQPVVVLTTYEARPLTTVAQLQKLIVQGEVRYALLTGLCGVHTARTNAACSPAALWVRTHAKDVSREAGLTRGQVLWLLPGAIP